MPTFYDFEELWDIQKYNVDIKDLYLDNLPDGYYYINNGLMDGEHYFFLKASPLRINPSVHIDQMRSYITITPSMLLNDLIAKSKKAFSLKITKPKYSFGALTTINCGKTKYPEIGSGGELAAPVFYFYIDCLENNLLNERKNKK